MKEHKIVLPCGGEPLIQAHAFVQRELIGQFGGYTAIEGFGAWKDDKGVVHKEPNFTYFVAHGNADKNGNRMRLNNIAMQAGIIGKQQCVYVVDSNGIASFINMPAPVAAAA